MSDPTFSKQFGMSVQADILRQAEQDRRRYQQTLPDDNLPLRPRVHARRDRVRPLLEIFGWRIVVSRSRAVERTSFTPWTNCMSED
jgi:hypothetical protein